MALGIPFLWNNEEFRDITAASAMRCRIDDRERGKCYERSVHGIEHPEHSSEMSSPTLSNHTILDTDPERQEFYAIVPTQSR
jgi:hypothetical protein